jgi:hypothetical protein
VAANIKTAEKPGDKPLPGVKGSVEYKTRSGITFGVSGNVSEKEQKEEPTRITAWEVMGNVKLAEW